MAETTRYANASLIQSLLGVLDDFERTLEHGEATEASTVLQGVKISYDRFMKVLTDHQVERIEATGKPFDPRYHEAMMQQPAEGAEPGTVLQELQRGYKLHDRVLRPTKVIVAGEPEQDDRTESTKDSTDPTSERQNPTSAAGKEKQ
jgi:molecular chaperone GrpE